MSNVKTFTAKQFCKDSDTAQACYSAEASTLGIAPGIVLPYFVLMAGDVAYHLSLFKSCESNGDITAWLYRMTGNSEGPISAIIFND